MEASPGPSSATGAAGTRTSGRARKPRGEFWMNADGNKSQSKLLLDFPELSERKQGTGTCAPKSQGEIYCFLLAIASCGKRVWLSLTNRQRQHWSARYGADKRAEVPSLREAWAPTAPVRCPCRARAAGRPGASQHRAWGGPGDTFAAWFWGDSRAAAAVAQGVRALVAGPVAGSGSTQAGNPVDSSQRACARQRGRNPLGPCSCSSKERRPQAQSEQRRRHRRGCCGSDRASSRGGCGDCAGRYKPPKEGVCKGAANAG